jgi:hypothetical protein
MLKPKRIISLTAGTKLKNDPQVKRGGTNEKRQFLTCRENNVHWEHTPPGLFQMNKKINHTLTMYSSMIIPYMF